MPTFATWLRHLGFCGCGPARNVILHKGGVIDEKALQRAPYIGRLESDIRVTPQEVAESIDTIQRVIEGVYARLIRT